MLRGLTPRFSSFDGDGFDEGRVRTASGRRPSLSTRGRLVLDPQAAGPLPGPGVRRRRRGGRARGAAPLDRPVVPRGRGAAFLRRAGARGARTTTAPAGARAGHLRAVAAAPRAARTGRDLPRELREPRRAWWAPSSRASRRRRTRRRARYEQAIRSARDNGFVQNEAIAYERRRGSTARAASDRSPTPTCARPATATRAGAPRARCAQLERRHPQLVERGARAPATTVGDAARAARSAVGDQGVADHLRRDAPRAAPADAAAVVLEEGGARRALVFFARAASDGRSRSRPRPRSARARTAVRRRPTARSSRSPVGTSSGPRARAARRRGRGRRPLLLRSRTWPAPARGRSCACRSCRRAEVVALLYLRTIWSRARSRPSACSVLELLARAGGDLARERAAARARARRADRGRGGEARALLLGEATAVMSSNARSDSQHGARRADPGLRARVRGLGNHRLQRGGRTRALAGAHRDPDKEPLSASSAERYRRARVRARAAGVAVLETGKPVLSCPRSPGRRSGGPAASTSATSSSSDGSAREAPSWCR